MTTEKFVDPPPFIQEWENADENTWPKPPPCLGPDVDYFSFQRNITRTRGNTFPDQILDINKDTRVYLKQLNHSILVAYLAIIKKQIDQPHEPEILSPYVEHIKFLVQVMSQALNTYRPFQAKKYYLMLFEEQIQQKEELYNQLKQMVDDANEKYKDFDVDKKKMEEC
ncbi:hypothetical protein EIN_229370 [Entamoeba invadens IP1]|uniref:Mediator of RNA polymerase II transcription subunit 7 n=1 Tax=Entamoeba invadens IP1 TaxID=370355 RepID=A0A0A1U312_ENTIV|nr:hypothetical protein EIN_229370 [Entamoeba invadens IP1]ELP88414.1 hypothetical protein EIN_229370 [Entamoeba invadens IP1]|eukprot:XP_004255185.1 hypothetical protein EIN_229370 [Entamoeba invadens IP1]